MYFQQVVVFTLLTGELQEEGKGKELRGTGYDVGVNMGELFLTLNSSSHSKESPLLIAMSTGRQDL